MTFRPNEQSPIFDPIVKEKKFLFSIPTDKHLQGLNEQGKRKKLETDRQSTRSSFNARHASLLFLSLPLVDDRNERIITMRKEKLVQLSFSLPFTRSNNR